MQISRFIREISCVKLEFHLHFYGAFLICDQRFCCVSYTLVLFLHEKCGVLLTRALLRLVLVSALIAFKRAIIEDPRSALADWSDADGNACDWHGVICSSPQGSVISL